MQLDGQTKHSSVPMTTRSCVQQIIATQGIRGLASVTYTFVSEYAIYILCFFYLVSLFAVLLDY